MINPSVAFYYAEELLRRQDSAVPAFGCEPSSGETQGQRPYFGDKATAGPSDRCDTWPHDTGFAELNHQE